MINFGSERKVSRTLAMVVSVLGATLSQTYYDMSPESGAISLVLSLILSSIGFLFFLSSEKLLGTFWTVTLFILMFVFSLLVFSAAGINQDGYNLFDQVIRSVFQTYPMAVIVTQILGALYAIYKP